jgi:hypothetical protein
MDSVPHAENGMETTHNPIQELYFFTGMYWQEQKYADDSLIFVLLPNIRGLIITMIKKNAKIKLIPD